MSMEGQWGDMEGEGACENGGTGATAAIGCCSGGGNGGIEHRLTDAGETGNGGFSGNGDLILYSGVAAKSQWGVEQGAYGERAGLEN
jgi:hypothetical protein